MKMKSRNFGLDLMRSLAIFLVLIEHFGYNPWNEILLGGIGVEVFFVLSGFLIGRILIRSFEKFNGFTTIRNFWINRWFRTIPLYFLALIIQILISGTWDWGYLYYFIFLQNNFYGISLYPISWSLVIEEWFYLGLPFVFLVFLLVRKKLEFKAIVFSLIFLILFKFLFVDSLEVPFTGVNGNALLRFDSMLIGVGLSWVYSNWNKTFLNLAKFKFFSLGIAGILIIQYVLFIHLGMAFINDSPFIKTIYFPLQSLFIALLLPYLFYSNFINEILPRNQLILTIISWTSILSYSFYLFHQNINQLIHWIFNFDHNGILALLVMYPLCYLIYSFYEKPMTNLREKFNG